MESQQVVHSYTPGPGTVTVEVERNSRGYNWRLKIDRPRADGATDAEAFDQAIDEIARANDAMTRLFGQPPAAGTLSAAA